MHPQELTPNGVTVPVTIVADATQIDALIAKVEKLNALLQESKALSVELLNSFNDISVDVVVS